MTSKTKIDAKYPPGYISLLKAAHAACVSDDGWFKPTDTDLADQLVNPHQLMFRRSDGKYHISRRGAEAIGVTFIVPKHEKGNAAPAPQSEAPEVDEDALADKEMNEGWYENEKGEYVNDNHPDLVGHLIAETVLSASAEPRTEAQPPADLAGDGKPEKKRAPKAEPVIEASKAYEDIEDLRSILKSILRDGFALGDDLPLLVKDGLKGLDRIESVVVAISPEFSDDDPLPTADLVHQVTELQTDLEAEKALRAGNLAQIKTLDETVVELTRRNAVLETKNKVLAAESQDRADGLTDLNETIDTLNQMLAQAQLAIKKLTAERDEARAAALKFTEFASHWRAIMALVAPEATAPQSAAPHKTNGVKP